MSVKIFEYLRRCKNPHVGNCKTRIAEFESFEEYLNLMAVQRTGMPMFYKLLNRSYDISKQEVMALIIDVKEDISYELFAKVIE
jgi:hypothetical protein